MSTIKNNNVSSTISKTKKSKAKNKKTAGSVTGINLGQPDALPATLCPSPPVGWVAPPATRFSVSAAQVAAAPAAAAELSSATTFAEDFGPAAPPPEAIGAALTLAAAWSAEATSVETYAAYVRAQEVRAWQLATEGIRAVKPCAEVVLDRSPDTAKRYAGLKVLLDVPKAIASRGAATKKEKRRAAKAATKETTAVVPDLVVPSTAKAATVSS